MKRNLLIYISILSYWLLSVPAAANMDVVFLLDTTGSMSSEIREVKERVFQLSTALKNSRKGEKLRFGVVAYRDKGDAYLTKVSPLRENIETSELFLATLEADGGGDSPEDILSGLKDTLEKISWSKSKHTEKLVFLIGDAPPHLDYAKGPKVEQLIASAQKNKIVINAIGCRSLSRDGIAFFRKIAYATEGRYQHIGRVKSGSPGLAEAMLSTLVPRTNKFDLSKAAPVTIQKTGDTTDSVSNVIMIQHSPQPLKKTSPCQVSVSVPKGLQLATEPLAFFYNNTLVFQLNITSGKGEMRVYQLPSCAHAKAPIQVMIGGAK